MLKLSEIKKNNIFKKTMTVIAVIVLGAIGNGIWQYVVEPLLSFSRDIILNITTLGIQSFKDSIYIDISMGFNEAASYNLLSLFKFFIIYIFLLLSIFVALEAYRIRKKQRGIVKQLDMCEKQECDQCDQNIKDISIEKREAQSLSRTANLLVKFSYSVILINIFLFVLLIVSSVNSNYVNKAITHYKQLCAITFPYFDEKEEESIAAQFAQIKSGSDYSKVIDMLESKAQENEKEISQFNIW